MSVQQSSAAVPGAQNASRTVARRRKFRFRREYYGFIFVIPAMIFFVLFNIYPMFSGLYYSFTRFTLLKPPVFIGLDNFIGLLTDKQFLNALSVTFLFVIGTTIPQWILSLGLALLFRG